MLMRALRFIILGSFLVIVVTNLAVAACGREDTLGQATKIAHGHAFTKHSAEFVHDKVIDGLAFPDPTIQSADDFTKFLNQIMNHPSEGQSISNGRKKYWDDETGTIIIYNPIPKGRNRVKSSIIYIS